MRSPVDSRLVASCIALGVASSLAGGLCIAVYGLGSNGLIASTIVACTVAVASFAVARWHSSRVRAAVSEQVSCKLADDDSRSDRREHECMQDVRDAIRSIQVRLREESAARLAASARTDELLEVLHVLQDPVFVFDAFGSIRLANEAACALAGSSTSIQRRDIREIFAEGQLRDSISSALEDCVVAGLSFECEYDVPMGVEAGTRTYEVRTLAIDEGAQGPFVLAMHDLTREREISRMKSDFVSKASHEIRTPLSSIRAHLEMLVDGEAISDEQVEQFHSMMLEDTDRLANLVENMLNISKIEAGIVRPQLERSDLGRIADAVVTRLEHAASLKDISLSISAATVDLSVEGDASMLQEVVENLVSNAIKYTPEGGRVSITIDTDALERSVLVSVSDTGLGIPAESREKVFEKFFRIPSYERMAHGTGLGLNLCRNIVESVHQGRIGVDSTVGEGSRFWFSVPMGFAGARAA